MEFFVYLVTLLVPAYTSFLVMRIGYYSFVERELTITSLTTLFLPPVSALWILVGFRSMTLAFFYPDNFQTALLLLAGTFVGIYFLYIALLWRLSSIAWVRKVAFQTMAWVTATTAIFFFQINQHW